MSFQHYESYKDSGVEWLGKVPRHWQVKRLKFAAANKKFAIVDGPFGTQLKADDYRENGVPLVRISNLSYSGKFDSDNLVFIDTTKAAELERSRISKGDVVVGKTGATIGKSALIKDFDYAIIASSCLKVSPNKNILSSQFLLYSVVSDGFLKTLINISGGSTRDTINIEPFGNLNIALPPCEEQAAIADFLDRKTAKIDALIAEQQRLIELLIEKRQAVISHAVTKGLNPNVPMKESGVEWLGEVPEHWETKRLKQIVEIPITDGPHETPRFYDEGVPFVSAEAISSGQIDFSKIRGFISDEDNALYSRKYKPKMHDIYMIKSGATTGVTAIVEDRMEFNIWSPLAVIRCGESVDPYFMLNYMRSRNFLDAISLNWSFGTQQNIGMGVIQNLACSIPSLHEQKLITKYLKEETEKLGELIGQSNQAIELLQERRSALISAAVTGKIDVRRLVNQDAS